MAREESREGKTPLNGELARRLNALYSNPEFNWNERHSIKNIWTALEDVHTSIRTVPSMIIFIDFIICIATGGDMKDAYVALWDFPRIWFIIS